MRRVLHVLQSVPVIFQRLPKPAGNSVQHACNTREGFPARARGLPGRIPTFGGVPQKVRLRSNTAFREDVKERAMENPLALITSLASGKNSNEFKGVVKRDWIPTGRIDFATKLDSNADPEQPGEFKLLVEERRIIESIAGNENLEIQWRAATLKEAKFVTTHYHKYLAENSLIRSPSEPEILPPKRKDKSE